MREGYTTQVCASPECNELVDIPAWFKPFAEYCEACRLEQKERFVDGCSGTDSEVTA